MSGPNYLLYFSLNMQETLPFILLSLSTATHTQTPKNCATWDLLCLTPQLRRDSFTGIICIVLYMKTKQSQTDLTSPCRFLAGSDQSEACWLLLWRMRCRQGKLPVWRHGALPWWHVEQHRLWVLCLQPGPGPLPDGWVWPRRMSTGESETW